jgi:hypothetical protein
MTEMNLNQKRVVRDLAAHGLYEEARIHARGETVFDSAFELLAALKYTRWGGPAHQVAVREAHSHLRLMGAVHPNTLIRILEGKLS